MVLKESGDERLLFETEVLREYLDAEILRKVQRSCIKSQLRADNYLAATTQLLNNSRTHTQLVP